MARESYIQIKNCTLCFKKKAEVIYEKRTLFSKEIKFYCLDCAKKHREINNEIHKRII